VIPLDDIIKRISSIPDASLGAAASVPAEKPTTGPMRSASIEDVPRPAQTASPASVRRVAAMRDSVSEPLTSYASPAKASQPPAAAPGTARLSSLLGPVTLNKEKPAQASPLASVSPMTATSSSVPAPRKNPAPLLGARASFRDVDGGPESSGDYD